MGETLTPNLGLIKPNKDTSTPLDVDQLNLNSDVLDDAARVQTVAPGVIPPAANLWDGKLVREATTGKVWVAEKQTNGSYLRRWVAFPWMIRANYTTTGGMQGVSRSTWKEILCPTLYPTHSTNATAADIVNGGRMKLPIAGTYICKAYTQWHEYGLENTTGQRITTISFGGAISSTYVLEGRAQHDCDTEDSGRNIMQQTTVMFRNSTPGSTVSIWCYQNSTSGGTGPLGVEGAEIEISLIFPDPTAS